MTHAIEHWVQIQEGALAICGSNGVHLTPSRLNSIRDLWLQLSRKEERLRLGTPFGKQTWACNLASKPTGDFKSLTASTIPKSTAIRCGLSRMVYKNHYQRSSEKPSRMVKGIVKLCSRKARKLKLWYLECVVSPTLTCAYQISDNKQARAAFRLAQSAGSFRRPKRTSSYQSLHFCTQISPSMTLHSLEGGELTMLDGDLLLMILHTGGQTCPHRVVQQPASGSSFVMRSLVR